MKKEALPCRNVMFCPGSFPPPCGVFCDGCKICCDLVNEIDSSIELRHSQGYAERTQKPDNINTRLNPDRIQRKNRTARDATQKDVWLANEEVTERGDTKLLEKNGTRMLQDFKMCHNQRRACMTCLRRQSEKGYCKNTVREDDMYPEVCAHCKCSRKCTARRVRYKGGRLRCIALCCIGKSTYGRLYNPRGAECC